MLRKFKILVPRKFALEQKHYCQNFDNEEFLVDIPHTSTSSQPVLNCQQDNNEGCECVHLKIICNNTFANISANIFYLFFHVIYFLYEQNYFTLIFIHIFIFCKVNCAKAFRYRLTYVARAADSSKSWTFTW